MVNSQAPTRILQFRTHEAILFRSRGKTTVSEQHLYSLHKQHTSTLLNTGGLESFGRWRCKCSFSWCFPKLSGECVVLFIDRCALIPAASTPVLVLQRNTAEGSIAESAVLTWHSADTSLGRHLYRRLLGCTFLLSKLAGNHCNFCEKVKLKTSPDHGVYLTPWYYRN